MENQNTNEIPESQENTATDAVQSAASADKGWQAYNVAKKDRNLFAKAIENGTLLPGADGKVDTSNATSLVRGTKYQGMTNILLKSFSKEHSFPTNEYVTANQLDHVNMAKQIPFEDSVKIRKGEKGITIHIGEKKKDENDKDMSSTRKRESQSTRQNTSRSSTSHRLRTKSRSLTSRRKKPPAALIGRSHRAITTSRILTKFGRRYRHRQGNPRSTFPNTSMRSRKARISPSLPKSPRNSRLGRMKFSMVSQKLRKSGRRQTRSTLRNSASR